MASQARSTVAKWSTICPHGRLRRHRGRYVHVLAEGVPSSSGESQRKVRVRLSVPFRVTKRQILCVGGDKLPFGWSFMSIAHVPMTWNPGDIWTVEVRLADPARSRRCACLA
jgi:hypothetical protein